MRQALLVGIGGFVGSMLRYWTSSAAQRFSPLAAFPLGTLVVNVVGCFAAGLIVGLAESRQLVSPEARLFLIVGLLGGFTTFSAFGLEVVSLARGRELALATAEVLLHLVLGFAAVWLGHLLARR